MADCSLPIAHRLRPPPRCARRPGRPGWPAAAPSTRSRRRRPRRAPRRHTRCRTGPMWRAVAAEARGRTECPVPANASVDVRSAGSVTSARSADISSSSRCRGGQQARPSALSAPRSTQRQSAARRWARASGPPSPRPARSALFSTATVGRSAAASRARSSGLSASAMTTTCTSAVAGIGCHRHARRGQRRRDRAAAHPVTAQHSNAQRRRNTIDDPASTADLWLCSANRVSASTKIWWPSVDPAQVKPGPHGACWPKCWHLRGHIANGCPQYQSKATVGYQSVPRCGYSSLMSDHGRMQTPRPDVAEPHLHPRVTSFRTRRSTLSGGQQATWERLWPEMGMHARDADGPAPRLDTESWFGRSAPVVLEIGSGTGISTLAMAQAEPHLDVVAVEVYRRGPGPAAQRHRPRRRHQHPAGPRRRRRRARAHVRTGLTDRRAGVLPRPVAEGPPPQAPAAAAGDRRADRRPAASRRCAARRHRPRRLRRTDRGGG